MIKINGAEPKGFRINGSEVKKMMYNGQIVWEGWSPYGNIAPEYGITTRTALIDNDINTSVVIRNTLRGASVDFEVINLCDRLEVLIDGFSSSVVISVFFGDGTSVSQVLYASPKPKIHTVSFDEKQVVTLQVQQNNESTSVYEVYLYGKVKL